MFNDNLMTDVCQKWWLTVSVHGLVMTDVCQNWWLTVYDMVMIDVYQKWRLAVHDMVTSVRCLPKQWLTIHGLVTAVRYLSKATADSWRLDDNSQMFVKSDSWQFKTWWQQWDVCQKLWLTVQDLVTPVHFLSKAAADYSWLGDSGMVLDKSDGWQLLAELLENDDGLHATLALKPARSHISDEPWHLATKGQTWLLDKWMFSFYALSKIYIYIKTNERKNHKSYGSVDSSSNAVLFPQRGHWLLGTRHCEFTRDLCISLQLEFLLRCVC